MRAYLLLLLIPISLVLASLPQVSPIWVFVSAGLAIIPLASWIRRATEQMARIAGSAVGGLLNVTFGNVTELVLALFVLASGHPDVVRAQITGSIIGNSLLGLGLAIVIGTWGRDKLNFQRHRAGLLSSLLFLAVIGLLVPALFDYTERGIVADSSARDLNESLSIGVSIILLILYSANLVYTLVTHRDVFKIEDQPEPAEWPLWKALMVLAAATVASAMEAHLISEALEMSATWLHVTPFFLGVIVLAIIGNAGEYVAAIYFARHRQMTMALSITIGSTIQVAILIAPLLVLTSYFMKTPMDLVFDNPLELISIAAVALIVNSISQDRETTWFEGVMLLSVYAILALAFFFVT